MGDPPRDESQQDPAAGAPPSESPEMPADAAGWHAFLADLPAAALLRVLQKDKARAGRLLAGFRADGKAVRHPVVVKRLVDAAMKEPAFAKELAESAPPPPAAPEKPAAPRPKPEPAPKAQPAGSGGGDAPQPIKAKLKEQRAALREREERIRALEAALADADRQNRAALAEIESLKAAKGAAEAEALRERRRLEREARRPAAAPAASKESPPAGQKKSSPAAAPPPAVTTLPAHPALFEDAMERMLSRGRHAAVADVCSEALRLLDEGASYGRRAEGVVRRLYAEALAASPDDRTRQRADEQERLALAAFLDAGDAAGAAGSWARLIARRVAAGSGGAAAALKPADAAPLARLAALMEKAGQTDAVRAAFARARAEAPEAAVSIRALLASGGKKLAPLLAAASPATGAPQAVVGPDEPLALPGLPAAVTARRLVRAVESGDEALVRQARAALRARRESGDPSAASLADALEAAVTALDPLAAVPLLRAQAPRPIVVDASNVARHDPDPLALTPQPRTASLRQMRDWLLRQGWFPVVLIADASLRYHVQDRAGYQALVDSGIVRETPSGHSADGYLIREARERGAPLVTNDRLQDWGDAAEGIERYGFVLFPGGAGLIPF